MAFSKKNKWLYPENMTRGLPYWSALAGNPVRTTERSPARTKSNVLSFLIIILRFLNQLISIYIPVIALFLTYNQLLCADNLFTSFGTKDTEIGFQDDKDYRCSVYYRSTIMYEPMELGVRISKRLTSKVNYHLKGSMINKDNIILQKNIFLKNELLYQYDGRFLPLHFLAGQHRFGMGFLSFPNIYSMHADATPILALVPYYEYDWNSGDIPFYKEINVWMGFKYWASMAHDPYLHGSDNTTSLRQMFGMVKMNPSLGINKYFYSIFNTGIDIYIHSYSGINNISPIPFSPQNSELAPFLKYIFSSISHIKVQYFYMINQQVFLEDYIYQYERIISELKLSFINLCVIYRIKDNLFAGELKTSFKNFEVSTFGFKNNNQINLGMQVAIYTRTINPFDSMIDKNEKLPDFNESADIRLKNRMNYYYLSNPPDVQGLDFNATVIKLDSPEKVAWYVGHYFNYKSKKPFRNPQQIFYTREGDCVDQMNFQTYCLRQHGYEAYTIQMLDLGSSHTICVYKNKNTGKWNAIDYWNVYEINADSYKEVFNKLYPGCVSFQIRNTDKGDIEKLYLMSSKLYIQNWLEED